MLNTAMFQIGEKVPRLHRAPHPLADIFGLKGEPPKQLPGPRDLKLLVGGVDCPRFAAVDPAQAARPGGVAPPEPTRWLSVGKGT